VSDLPGGDIEVVAAGRRLTFAPAAREPLSLLLSGQPAEIDAIAQTTGTDAGSLARTLIKETLCAAVHPALASGYTGLVPPATCLRPPWTPASAMSTPRSVTTASPGTVT
jgi:hypothetical protein